MYSPHLPHPIRRAVGYLVWTTCGRNVLGTSNLPSLVRWNNKIPCPTTRMRAPKPIIPPLSCVVANLWSRCVLIVGLQRGFRQPFYTQVSHPYNSSKTIFVFSQPTLTSAQHIAWAAGPFHTHAIPADLSSAEDASGTAQPVMHAFCLPGHETFLTNTVAFMRSAMCFYVNEFGSYPFGSHKLVFVEEMPTQRFDAATLSLVSVDLLHGEDAIDPVYETRHSLSHALACQWIGINIQQKMWSDTWLVNGLGLYITGLYMRKIFGTNEYRFRLKKDMERVIELDTGSMPPICQPQSLDPPDPFNISFMNLKSPLVLHILDRRLGKSGTSLGLSRVLPKLFLSAISGEMANNLISTHSFLRMCRKVSGIDPRSFAEQWIYGSGCPTFGFSASFNRKKMAVEITMRQDAPAYKHLENNEIGKAMMKPVPFFEVSCATVPASSALNAYLTGPNDDSYP